MQTETIIRAWKEPRYRATLKGVSLPPNPAGSRTAELDPDALRGAMGVMMASSGWVCTLSGECNGGCGSCWDPTEPTGPCPKQIQPS